MMIVKIKWFGYIWALAQIMNKVKFGFEIGNERSLEKTHVAVCERESRSQKLLLLRPTSNFKT